jgi:hypothetical protein
MRNLFLKEASMQISLDNMNGVHYIG